MIYPRPQMKRAQWQNLDGEWIINGRPGKVPSCRTEEKLIYEKSFIIKKESDRVLLHFGAVDQIAKIYLNGNYIGEHTGGYLPFTFDVTEQIKESNCLRVEVEDTLNHDYPYGKQRKDRGGMWYTPMSGIWKSVWLEQVPEEYISDIKITPDLKGAELEIFICKNGKISVEKQRIEIENPELWTPDNPKLYTKTITAGNDSVEIYFALRTVSIENIDGINRVCLNGKPVFLHGVLNQGYYENGLMTPEDPSEFEKDVIRMKNLGFNLLRTHIIIEPEQYYYACDRLGMLVMQDMVNSGDYHFFKDTLLGTAGFKFSDKKKIRDFRMKFFIQHSKDTINHLYNHPCIISYTIFNEGWGQFDSDNIYSELKLLDSSRLYDSTSGWFKQHSSDFDSEHIYFRLKKLKPDKRPLLVSECGGYSLNTGKKKDTYGYGACRSSEELTERITALYEKMIIPAIEKGCCGCIYTQLSDIEDEINGLYSYDRKTCKVDVAKMQETSKNIFSKI